MTQNNLPTLSIRLDFADGTRFGPGKAALLSAIQKEGSIASAARALEMSYPRALKLIESMNVQFSMPLVTTHQGGAERGGAKVTALGQSILSQYDMLTDTCSRAAAAPLAEINKHSAQGKPAKKLGPM